MTTRLPLAPETLVIHPHENLLRYAEFADDLETGESLTGTPTAVELDTSDLSISEVALDGTKVNLRIDPSAASENTLYHIEIKCDTDMSNEKVLMGRLKVTRLEGDTPAT